MERAEQALATPTQPQGSSSTRTIPEYQPPARPTASEAAQLLMARQEQVRQITEPQRPPAGAVPTSPAAQAYAQQPQILVRSEGTVSAPVHSPVEQPAALVPAAQTALPPRAPAAASGGSQPKLLTDMDATMIELQEKEAVAVGSKLYKVAQDLQEAMNDLHTLKFSYQELVAEESVAVRMRDYTLAAQVKQKQTLLLKTYAAIKRRDYFNDQTEPVRLSAEGTPIADTANMAAVRFCIHHPVDFGKHMTITGSAPELGSWNVEKSQMMQWTEGDNWVSNLNLPLGTKVQFKFVIEGPPSEDGQWDGREWQEGANREFEVPMEPTLKVDVTCCWKSNPKKDSVWVCQPLRTEDDLMATGTLGSMSDF